MLEEKEKELMQLLEETQEKEVRAFDQLKDALVESSLAHKQRQFIYSREVNEDAEEGAGSGGGGEGRQRERGGQA